MPEDIPGFMISGKHLLWDGMLFTHSYWNRRGVALFGIALSIREHL